MFIGFWTTGPRGIKKIAVNKTSVCYPSKAQFAINSQSIGHPCDIVHFSKAVFFFAILPPEVAPRTTIALMVGWDESSIFVNWFWGGIVTVRTFYPGIFDSNWWLLRIKSLALGFHYTVDYREIEIWLKSHRIWKITTQEGNYPQWQ